MFAMGTGIAEQRTATGFISKYGAALDILMRIGDVAIVILAGVAVHHLRFNALVQPPYLAQIVRASLLTLLVFPVFHIYRSWRGASLGAELLRIALAWAAVMALMLVWEWAIKVTDDFSRLWTFGWFVGGLLLMAGSRLLVRAALGFVRARGLDHRRVVLVGATAAAARVLAATRSNPWLGMDVQGYVATEYDQPDSTHAPCLGDFDSFLGQLRTNPPDQIWVALPLRAEALIERLLDATADIPTTVRLVPDLLGYELINHNTGSIAGVPVITLRGSRVVGHFRVLKAIEDRVLATIILLLVGPLMLLLALGVKLSSPGPVFYRQRRVGLDGREFDMLKFRSMPVDVEKGGVFWGGAKGKQATPFGRFIRASSLDELPQFINVLKGELSIVGPRPERPMFVEEFRKSIPGYMHKHLVKGGITGWAQINGWRGDTDLEKRIEFDLFYINRWSIWLDLKIIFATPLVLLKGTNAC